MNNVRYAVYFGGMPTETLEPEVITPLTPQEAKTLARLESVIRDFREAYYEAGVALRIIRDDRLYRENYRSFEDYVQDRWEISRPRAYELMNAARVIKNLSGIADVSMTPESQLRVLGSLDPEDQIQIYTRARSGAPEGKVTASLLKEVRSDYLATKLQTKPEPTTEPVPAKKPPSPNALKAALNIIHTMLGGAERKMVEQRMADAPWDVIALSKLDPKDMRKAADSMQKGRSYPDIAKKLEPSGAAIKKALDRIKGVLGSKGAWIDDPDTMPASEKRFVVELSQLPQHQIIQVATLLAQGWSQSDALKEVQRTAVALTGEDKIRDLHAMCREAGGSLQLTVDGFLHVVVTPSLVTELQSRLKGWPKPQ